MTTYTECPDTGFKIPDTTEAEFLAELTRRYPQMVLISAKQATEQLHWIREAYRCIGMGVDLMPLHHLSKWEGVRGVLESCPVSNRYLASHGIEALK